MRPASLFILFLLAAGPNALGAQDSASPASPREPLSEAVFLAALDAAHPASRALAGDLARAEAESLRASLLPDPRLEVAREAPEDLARETTWGVAWTPPIDGRRRSDREAADAEVEAESHLLEARLLELRFALREAYAAWAAGEARVSILTDHSEQLEALARRMRDRAAAGEESMLAARRMEIALERSNVALSAARGAAAAGRQRTAAWLLETDREISAARPDLPDLPDTPKEAGAFTDRARPDVLAARSRVEQAEAVERSSRRTVESPELLLGWKRIDNDPAGNAADVGGPVLALGWKIPLFDRRRADRRAAKSAVAAAIAGEEWAAKRASGELAATLDAYRELRQSALAAWARLEDHDDIARAATASFEQGESTITDLLDTLGALLEVRLATLDLYAAALETHRRLELAAGRTLSSGDLS